MAVCAQDSQIIQWKSAENQWRIFSGWIWIERGICISTTKYTHNSNVHSESFIGSNILKLMDTSLQRRHFYSICHMPAKIHIWTLKHILHIFQCSCCTSAVAEYSVRLVGVHDDLLQAEDHHEGGAEDEHVWQPTQTHHPRGDRGLHSQLHTRWSKLDDVWGKRNNNLFVFLPCLYGF